MVEAGKHLNLYLLRKQWLPIHKSTSMGLAAHWDSMDQAASKNSFVHLCPHWSQCIEL